MKTLTMAIALGLLTVSCQKREEVTASETRPATMRDNNLKLDADNDERFGASAPAADGPFVANYVPSTWREQPGNSFRLLNYAFGTGGEVSVGLSRGGLLENVNRWLGQFGREPIDAAGMEEFSKVRVAGYDGVMFGADGTYAPGMGRTAMADQGLMGIIAEKDGQILTVKMVGPKAQVESEKINLRAFAADLRANE
ncbi:MAG: hypothetical protein AAGI48_12740 [Verrucomicrobiota bacterium]